MIDISEDEELSPVLHTEAEDVQDKSGTSSRGQDKGWPSAGFDKRTTKQRGKGFQREVSSSDDLMGPKKVGKVDKKQKRKVKYRKYHPPSPQKIINSKIFNFLGLRDWNPGLKGKSLRRVLVLLDLHQLNPNQSLHARK